MCCVSRFHRVQLSDCLKVTLSDQPIVSKTGHVHRTGDDLAAKLSEHKRDEIKVGAKVFLNTFAAEHLSAAIDQLLGTLNVNSLDNLIVAYHPTAAATTTNGVVLSNGHANGANGTASAKEGELSYSGEALVQLQQLWKVLERYASADKIGQLGIADLDTESLQQLYASSTVKPTIAQINLSACCVVPPSLQEFCNANEIQLLTHSDPEGKSIEFDGLVAVMDGFCGLLLSVRILILTNQQNRYHLQLCWLMEF